MSAGSFFHYWQSCRNYIAFWAFGLFNNFNYVVMLSAAVDILEKGSPKNLSRTSPTNGRANCTEVGTGAVLLADIGPGLLIKFLAPVVIRRLHFHLKVSVSALFALAAFFIVSSSKSVTLSLFGVVCAGISCGLGDVTFLTMVAFFKTNVVSAWSSGTGAAGIVGAVVYASLTSVLTPERTLLVATFAPLAMLFSYFVILKKPATPVFQTSYLTASCCRRETQFTRLPVSEEEEEPIVNEDEFDTMIDSDSQTHLDDSSALQISPSWEVKKRLFKRLSHSRFGATQNRSGTILPLIVWLSLVYFFEYLINQALFELIYFDNADMTHEQQYRWFQVTYQCGVFLSRSSLSLFHVKNTWVLAILQATNFAFFLTQVIVPFMKNIAAVFVLISFEGVLGGLSYVNTFHEVLTTSDANTREYSMSIAAFSDAFGIACAAFLAIPLHNWLCHLIA